MDFAYGCTLLRNLPPHCHLLLHIYTRALLKSRCQLDCIVSDYAIHKIYRRCHALSLQLSSRQLKETFSILSNLHMSSPDCKLLQLSLICDSSADADKFDDDNHSADAHDDSDITQSPDDRTRITSRALADDDSEDHYMIGISRALNEGCKLKRFDVRGLPPLGPKNMSLLVASIASPSCPIHDLGINLSYRQYVKHNLDEAQCKSSFSILAQAFQSGSSLSKLKALRFKIDTNEAAACVVEILTTPPSNCKPAKNVDEESISSPKPDKNKDDNSQDDQVQVKLEDRISILLTKGSKIEHEGDGYECPFDYVLPCYAEKVAKRMCEDNQYDMKVADCGRRRKEKHPFIKIECDEE